MNTLAISIVFCFFLFTAGVLPVQAELVFGPDSESAGDNLDIIVAIVDDDVITRGELDSAIDVTMRQMQQQGTPLPARDTLESQVLDRLILTKLQLRAAERNGIVVDDPTLNAAMENLAQQNQLTLSQLRETVENDGLSFANFREEIRRQILFTRLRQRLVDSRIQVSEQEVDNLMTNATAPAQGNSEYHIAQILIVLPEGATPEQIEAGQQQGQEVLEQLRQGADFQRLAATVSDGRQALEGGDLGWRTAEQLPTIFADVIPRLQPGQVSDLIRSPSGFHIVKLLDAKGAVQQSTTQTHARHILINTNEVVSDEEAQQRLLRLRERIQNGADFGELAQANSNDTVSAIKGGDLGWITPADLVPEFATQMNDLSPDEVSEPFKTRFGWHLVQVLERRQQQGTDESQRARVRELLFQRRVEEEWDLWLRRLRDEAYVEIRLPTVGTQETS